MTAASTSREAVERAIHWWQQQDRGSEEDGAASASLGRMCRALLDERDAALATIRDLRTSLDAERAHGDTRAQEVRDATADLIELAGRLTAAENERDEARRALGILEADFDDAVKDQAALHRPSPRHVRATLLAPWLSPVLAGALFALWVAAHLLWWVVL